MFFFILLLFDRDNEPFGNILSIVNVIVELFNSCTSSLICKDWFCYKATKENDFIQNKISLQIKSHDEVEMIEKNFFRSSRQIDINKIVKCFYSHIATNVFYMLNNEQKYPIFSFINEFQERIITSKKRGAVMSLGENEGRNAFVHIERVAMPPSPLERYFFFHIHENFFYQDKIDVELQPSTKLFYNIVVNV